MHIEPGLVEAGKLALGYATAAGAVTGVLATALAAARTRGVFSLVARSLLTTALVLCFFEILPHRPVGVSEVHFILGSTLFLLFGAAPAAVGLALGLLVQGLVFAPFDLPQYGMNVTTLLVPLFAIAALSRRVIRPDTPYVAVGYRQALVLSTTYQGGVVAWVGFWAFYGQGFGMANVQSIVTFGVAYLGVVLIEPLVDLGVLAVAKALARAPASALFERRLYQAEGTV
ncbi:MAG: energy-coupling factor ABC transporter permease [Gammaproteobacteria bacterium]